MLPEVEEVFPFLRRRQNAIQDSYLKRPKVVDTWLRVRRNRNARDRRRTASVLAVHIVTLADIDAVRLHLVGDFVEVAKRNADAVFDLRHEP